MTSSTYNLVHDIDDSSSNTINFAVFALILIVALALGTGVGYLLGNTQKSATNASTGVSNKEAVKTAGIADKSTFKDKAEGLLKEGGINGEGNFHLERPGGESQNVYLTSTTVDLSQYIGKKVRVWGATFQGQEAGWLMDVGFVEVLQ